MPTAPLFQRFVDDELALAPTLAQRALAGTTQLLGHSKDIGSVGEKAQYGDIVKALQRDATVFERTFVDSLGRRVSEELDGHRDATYADRGGVGALELMDETRVEVDIELSRAVHLIDSTAEWELRELQTFTSTLTGQRHVSSESNPFRPLVYASALWDAACAVVSSPTQRVIVLRTAAGVVAGLLKNAWAAATTRLEGQGVQPGVYRTVVLPSGASFGRAGSADTPRGNAAGGMGALLANMSAAADAGGADPRIGPPAGVRNDGGGHRANPELEQALLRLDEVQRHFPADASLTGRGPPGTERLEQHRAALVASARDTAERQIIELVTRLFDSMLGDSQLQAAFRPAIARLHGATLRVVLADPTALDDDDHPAWRLIDRIGATSLGHSRAEDARLVAFRSCVSAVAEEMAGARPPDTTLFRRGLNRIDAFLAEQLQAQLRGAHATVEALRVAERREILEQHLAHRLTDQMVSVRTSPTIRRFVTGAWARVIAEDMLRHGDQSEQTLSDLKTVDDLLWSLKIPDHPQSRQRLLQLLPTLLQRVRVGMELIALPMPEQQGVLDELMAIHTDALRPGARAGGGGQALTPEEIVQRMRDEVRPEAAQPRAFSDSVIDLSSMETVPAEHLPSSSAGSSGDADADDPGRLVESLRAGDRQRIFLQGRWSRVQLLWRSDRSLFFLFAGDAPHRTHSITRRALERLGSAGLVQPIETRPLVARAVERMTRQLASRPPT